MPRPRARPWHYVGAAGRARRPRGWLAATRRLIGLFAVNGERHGSSLSITNKPSRSGTLFWRDLLVWLAATAVGGAFLAILWHYQWGLALTIAVLWLGWSGWELRRRS